MAINEEGVRLIGGGVLFGGGTIPAYAVLVAPNGTLTELSEGNFPSMEGRIFSVDLNSEEILDRVVPKSYGPGNSYANAVFPLTSQILPNRVHYHHKESYNRPSRSENPDIGYFSKRRTFKEESFQCLVCSFNAFCVIFHFVAPCCYFFCHSGIWSHVFQILVSTTFGTSSRLDRDRQVLLEENKNYLK